MPLADYIHPKTFLPDKFEAEDNTPFQLAFPCCACKHATGENQNWCRENCIHYHN